MELLTHGIHAKLSNPSWLAVATPSVSFSYCGWEIRNDVWTFESVRAKYGKIGAGRHVYEVELNTDGIIQIGWSDGNCVFDPESGTGVGDDFNSYSYDGHRQRKWHKGDMEVNSSTL